MKAKGRAGSVTVHTCSGALIVGAASHAPPKTTGLKGGGGHKAQRTLHVVKSTRQVGHSIAWGRTLAPSGALA